MINLKKIGALLLCLLLLPLSAPAEEAITLRVDEWIQEDVLAAFTEKYPHITVELAERTLTVQESILSGENIDLYTVEAAGAYEEIIAKGYAAPMEDAALIARAQRLLPALQKVVFREGKLMAFPQSLSLVTWTLDVTAFEEAGFSESDAPRTLAEFLAQFARWQNELQDDFPDQYFFEGGSLADLLGIVVRQYIAAHDTGDAAISFDSPDFRAAIALLNENRTLFEQNQAKAEAMANGEISGMPIIYNYNMSYGYTSLDSHIARPLNIPALSEDAPPFTEGESTLYFISARSEHPAEAALLVEFLAENAYVEQQYGLYADLNTPLENPGFPALKAQFTEEMASVSQKLASCKPEDKQPLEDRLAWLEGWMARQEEIRYWITKADIDLHRALTENLAVPTKSLYLAYDSNCYASLSALMARFAAGEIDQEFFISEMDRTCKLAFLEQ